MAGVAHFYWNTQMDLCNRLKRAPLSTAVADSADALLDDDYVNANNVRPFGNGSFTRYEDVTWGYKDGEIRCDLGRRRKSRKIQGSDTLVSLKAAEGKPVSKKRKATTKNKVRQEIGRLKPQIGRLKQQILEGEQQILEGEASRAQLLRIKDFHVKQIEEHAATALGWRRKKQQLKSRL